MGIEILSIAVNPDIRDHIHIEALRLGNGFEEEVPGAEPAVISADFPGEDVS